MSEQVLQIRLALLYFVCILEKKNQKHLQGIIDPC